MNDQTGCERCGKPLRFRDMPQYSHLTLQPGLCTECAGQKFRGDHAIDVEVHQDHLRGVTVVTARIGFERHTRSFQSRSDELRVAGNFWRHGDLMDELGYAVSAMTDRCLALEWLFPDLADRLPV